MYGQGCHLALKKAKSALFGLFWNSFLEIRGFGHLAFSWPFFNLEENSIFLGLFWQNFNKTYNILWYFKIFLIYFGKFSLKIWPLFGRFHHLRIWPFLTLLMAKFGLFIFWDLATLCTASKLVAHLPTPFWLSPSLSLPPLLFSPTLTISSRLWKTLGHEMYGVLYNAWRFSSRHLFMLI